MNISFEEAFNGAKKKFSVRVPGKTKAESISLKIPPTCKEGAKLRLKGQGKPIPGSGNGDLIVEIHIDSHPYFSFDKEDVIVDVPVSFCEAALGSKIEIPTPDGKKLRIKIPAGTQNGSKFTIKGHGAKKSSSLFGNLVARIEVVIPKELNSKQKKIINEYAEIENMEVRPW